MKVKGKVYALTFTELYCLMITDVSYRKCSLLLNRTLNRPEEDGICFRTLKDYALRLGSGIDRVMMEDAEEILSSHGFAPDTGLPVQPEMLDKGITEPAVTVSPDFSREKKEKVLEEYNSRFADDEPNQIKDVGYCISCEKNPSSCVYISVDDIGVKRQKESRKEGYVRNRRL